MYMDKRGDTEANYTVLALFTNHSVSNRSDLQRYRTMRPVGHFQTGELTSPVSVTYQTNKQQKAQLSQRDRAMLRHRSVSRTKVPN